MNNLSVLIVEDIPQVRATAVRILQDVGCEVFDTYHGWDALNLLRSHPGIEVLFADIRMPGMDGFELAEAARRLRPDLKVVLTSGYVGPRDIPDNFAFVAKPWRAEDVAEAVAPQAL